MLLEKLNRNDVQDLRSPSLPPGETEYRHFSPSWAVNDPTGNQDPLLRNLEHSIRCKCPVRRRRAYDMRVAGMTYREIAKRLCVGKEMIRIEIIRATRCKSRSWTTHHFVTDADAARYLIGVLKQLETACMQPD